MLLIPYESVRYFIDFIPPSEAIFLLFQGL